MGSYRQDDALDACKNARKGSYLIDRKTAETVLSWFITPAMGTVDTPNILVKVEKLRRQAGPADKLCLNELYMWLCQHGK